MLGVARATLGEAWAQARAKLKKTELATVMEEAFAGGDAAAAGVPAEAREPARFWVMPGFQAYDNRGLDDGDNDGDKESGVTGDGGPDGDTEDAAPAAETAPDGGIDEDDDNRVDVQPGTGDANLPTDVADGTGTAGAVPDTGDDTDPQTPPVSVVESIDSPAVAERLAASRAAALDYPERRPHGGRRSQGHYPTRPASMDDASVDDGSGGATPSAGTASGEPAGGNGHDSGDASAGLLEIPAFLRRS